MQGRLVAVEHDQLGRGEAVDLATQLGADGPAGSGDEQPQAGHEAGGGGDVGVDLVAAQEVGHGGRADVAHPHLPAEELAHRWQDLDLQAGLLGQVGLEVTDHLGLGAGALGHLLQAVAGAHHRHLLDAQVALAGVVVEQAHRQVAAVGVTQHGGEHLSPALAGPDDHHRDAAIALGPAVVLDEQAPHAASSGRAHQGHGTACHRTLSGSGRPRTTLATKTRAVVAAGPRARAATSSKLPTRQRPWYSPHSSPMSRAIRSKAGRKAANEAKLLGLRGKVVALGQG